MGLEAANFISGLDESWPTGLDPVNKGDDHIRLVKQVLKDQFPGVGGDGYAESILALEDDLNNTIGSTGNFQDQIDALTDALAAANAERSPVGGIIMYNGLLANIPSNWAICNGSNGTPNMVDKFVYGTVTEGQIGDTGGSANAVNVSHGHSASAGDDSPDHSHNFPTYDDNGNNGPNVVSNSDPEQLSTTTTNGASTRHSHSVTVVNSGESGVGKNIPPYVKLAYIQRLT